MNHSLDRGYSSAATDWTRRWTLHSTEGQKKANKQKKNEPCGKAAVSRAQNDPGTSNQRGQEIKCSDLKIYNYMTIREIPATE